ncbi:MAG: sigma-70 family RNA polymerase sigma factor [Acidobacteria bacterium]|nr:sigma-70 family RNA polymerase sigma factor [Acidobacteriota bacterium]
MGYDNEDDVVLVRRCVDGDRAAFEPLVARYHRPLFNLAARLLGNRDEALDSTQNGFVKAYEHLASFDTDQRFFSWIYQIVRNECLNVIRARRPEAPLPGNLEALDSPAMSLEHREQQALVQAALMRLSDEQREVILLRHFTELSYEEIAGATGVPVKTVKSRLYAARQRLAAILSETISR